MEAIKRIIVAVIAIPLLIWVFYSGGYPFLIFLGAVSIISSLELRKMFLMKNIKVLSFLPVLNLIIFIIASYSYKNLLPIMLFLVFSISILLDLFSNKLDGAVERASSNLFCSVYVGVLPGIIFRISQFDNGNLLFLALIGLIWITDTFAYFLGMTIGKHRGIFKASPKKSIEGFIAGIVFAFIAAILTAKFLPQYFTMTDLLIAAFAASIFGQLGDLIESTIKRDFQVKDSSNLIPGHGGILDRFDSMLIAAPVFYLIYTLTNL